MRLEIVVPCVEYDDFLRLTLPSNLQSEGKITVLTSGRDARTIALAQFYRTELFLTEDWWFGGPFNKAAALNRWLDTVSVSAKDTWVMVLDADILLPFNTPIRLDNLDPTFLYGAKRRMCADETAWNDFVQGKRTIEMFPLDVIPVRDGRAWGNQPTSNPAALCGYMQLWNPVCASCCGRFPLSGTAALYDVKFGLSFPEDHRVDLPGFEVLHLGTGRTNWAGRRTPRWVHAHVMNRCESAVPQRGRDTS
jgi:hypothetical protein